MAAAQHLAFCVILLALFHNALSVGMKCSSHPLYKDGFKGELPRGWTYAEQEAGRFYFTQSGYFPRYSEHGWAPLNEPTSTKYKDLDYFNTWHGKKSTDNFVTLHFQRPALVYMFISHWQRDYPAGTLPGFKFEGWAKLVKGSDKTRIKVGISRKGEYYAPGFALVFSKPASEMVSLPDARWVAANIRGVNAKGYYHVMVAEADGSSVKPPAPPAGVTVEAGARCPEKLHDAWMVKGPDPADPLTKDKLFRTWHPQWDPCYFCAYSHEHGSGSKELMGYTPTYGYVALKNGNENESHEGFKGFVFKSGKYFVYYELHAKLSDPRRFSTQFHTKVIAITDADTKELLVELKFKADYGFLATRLKAGGHYALTAEGKALQEAQDKYNKLRKMRVINVINPGNLDPRFKYRPGDALMHGDYEQWITTPICSTNKKWKEPTVDIKDPALALRSASGSLTDVTKLGTTFRGAFYQHVSVNREFRLENLEISDELCVFKLPDIEGKAVNGKFYTDPYGKKLKATYGPGNVAQFIKPGFKHSITGHFEVAEPWLGLHKDGMKGFFPNIGYGLDPLKN